MDFDSAVKIVAERMSRRAKDLKGLPHVELVELIMNEVGCKDYEDFLRRFLDDPKEFYDLALSRLNKPVAESLLGLLYVNIFSRFGLGELGVAFFDAVKAGDKAKMKEVFMKLAEVINELEEREKK